METLTIIMSFLTTSVIPIVIPCLLYKKNISDLQIIILFICCIWIVSSGSLTTIKLLDYKNYKIEEDIRLAQVLIDHNLTNSINTNIQYNIDKLLFEKYMKEKYGK